MTSPVTDEEMRAILLRECAYPYREDRSVMTADEGLARSHAFIEAARAWIPGALERLARYQREMWWLDTGACMPPPGTLRFDGWFHEPDNKPQRYGADMPIYEIEYRRVLGAEKQEEKVVEPVKAWAFKKLDGAMSHVSLYRDPSISYGGAWVPVEVRELAEEEPEPARCVCGEESRVEQSGLGYIAGCRGYRCWCGPYRPTRAEAVKAWDDVVDLFVKP